MKRETVLKEQEVLKEHKAVGQRLPELSTCDTTFFTADYARRHHLQHVNEINEALVSSPILEQRQMSPLTKLQNQIYPGASQMPVPKYVTQTEQFCTNQQMQHPTNTVGPANYHSNVPLYTNVPMQHHSGDPMIAMTRFTVNPSPELLQRAVNHPLQMQYRAANPNIPTHYYAVSPQHPPGLMHPPGLNQHVANNHVLMQQAINSPTYLNPHIPKVTPEFPQQVSKNPPGFAQQITNSNQPNLLPQLPNNQLRNLQQVPSKPAPVKYQSTAAALMEQLATPAAHVPRELPPGRLELIH